MKINAHQLFIQINQIMIDDSMRKYDMCMLNGRLNTKNAPNNIKNRKEIFDNKFQQNTK